MVLSDRGRLSPRYLGITPMVGSTARARPLTMFWTKLEQNFVECGGTGSPAATSESRPVLCAGGFWCARQLYQ